VTEPVKVGVIGVGALGTHHARVYDEMAGATLAGVADIVESRARECGTRHGCPAYSDSLELLANVDAVSVAVPTEEHALVGIQCLEAGVDVLVEKPIASTSDEARALVGAAGKGNRILQVGHIERFNPVVQAATEIATRPQFFEVHRLSTFSMRSLDVDVVLDLMIHDIDIVLSLVDSPVAEIRAAGIPVLSPKADIANVRIEFADGCVANMTASRVSTERVRKLRFFQPNDYLSLDYAEQSGYCLSLRGGRIENRKLEPRNEEPLRLQLEAFVAAVGSRSNPLVDGEAGLRALEVALSANEEIARHHQRRARGTFPG
jgi:predicted dehydrogenase